jgi:hypothetical protein
MKFAADPMSVALALGLLGPAAVDEHGVFDDGRTDVKAENLDLARALSEELDLTLVDDAGDDLTETWSLGEE